jgi:tyrosine-protein phosphatase YwqE
LPAGLMPFGNNNVLVEVSMAGWPRNFDELIFKVQAQGYRPILAHPERYIYETNMDFYEQLRNRGVVLQLNLLSVTGYYGKIVKDNAMEMLERNLYTFCGTDLHHERHLARILKMPELQPATMNKLVAYGFENTKLCV